MGEKKEYDAILIGGSFSGLSTAYFTEGGEVLLLEKEKGVGMKQRSACATFVDCVEKMGGQESILQTFSTLTFHSPGGTEAVLRLPTPLCTLDYRAFCEGIAEGLEGVEVRTDAAVREIVDAPQKRVMTQRGSYVGRVVVDCSGWKAVSLKGDPRGYTDRSRLAYGIEAEMAYSEGNDSLHVFFDNRLIRGGYAWIFPTSEKTARIGIGSCRPFNPAQAHRRFLLSLGVKAKPKNLHGGYIPCFGLREPIAGGVFRVGDSAGMALPFSAEGIRKGIEYGEVCGTLLSRLFREELSLQEALESYRRTVLREAPYFDLLLEVQRLAPYAPPFLWERAIRRIAGCGPEVQERLVRSYREGVFPPSRRRWLLQGLKALFS
jgi:flavin-dependent dehydrogenase